MQSIWIIGADGHVSATGHVATLPNLDISSRDYFAAQTGRDAGPFVGAVLQPLLNNGLPFFAVSRRRDGPAGAFGGVVAASLLPADFVKFYQEIGQAPGSFLALMRTDGTLLARYPPIPSGDRPALRSPILVAPILKAIASPLDRGIMTVASPVDGREARIAWRRIDPYPVFVMAGLETAAIRDSWLGTLSTHLIFGVPPPC